MAEHVAVDNQGVAVGGTGAGATVPGDSHVGAEVTEDRGSVPAVGRDGTPPRPTVHVATCMTPGRFQASNLFDNEGAVHMGTREVDPGATVVTDAGTQITPGRFVDASEVGGGANDGDDGDMGDAWGVEYSLGEPLQDEGSPNRVAAEVGVA